MFFLSVSKRFFFFKGGREVFSFFVCVFFEGFQVFFLEGFKAFFFFF